VSVHTSQHISGFGELAVRLAKAVGLDADNCLAFTIDVHPERLIEIRANQRTVANGIEEVIRIFEVAKQEGATPVEMKRPFIPVARLEDLRIRAIAGSLTNAERLALAVLAGGRDGEEGVPALIDAATEEYSHGSYRIPVRIVADRKRMKFILAPYNQYSAMSRLSWDIVTRELQESLANWMSDQNPCLMIPAGWSIQVFEFDGIGPQVEISKPNEDGLTS
jgi:hypothetical protein